MFMSVDVHIVDSLDKKRCVHEDEYTFGRFWYVHTHLYTFIRTSTQNLPHKSADDVLLISVAVAISVHLIHITSNSTLIVFSDTCLTIWWWWN